MNFCKRQHDGLQKEVNALFLGTLHIQYTPAGSRKNRNACIQKDRVKVQGRNS
jgi:hypothetical protein